MAPLPRSRRLIVWSSLAIASLLAWLYLLWMPMSVADLGAAGALFRPLPSSWANAILLFMMWAIMMVAMMLPSASPVIAAYARGAGRRSAAGGAIASFTAGYLAVWTIFSLIATMVQAALHGRGILSARGTLRPTVGGAVLIAAALYQFTPLKRSCLTGCRSPMRFVTSERRRDGEIAFVTGFRHGLSCLGCCWMIMALLFVFGVMNVAWAAALSILVLLEKVLPAGRLVARVSGVAMFAAGIALMLQVSSASARPTRHVGYHLHDRPLDSRH